MSAEAKNGLKVELTGEVLRLTLARPERGNALAADLVEALLAQVEGAAAQSGEARGVRLLVIEAEGRNFCTGFDFGGIEEESDASLAYRFLRLESLLQAVHYAPFETLCLARGRVLGAGADLFNACGRRIAAPGTSFNMPGLGFGILLGTRRFIATTGDAGRAILAEGRAFEVGEALRLGFVEALAEEADWPALTETIARRVSRLSADSLRRLNRVARSAAGQAAGADADMAELARSVSQPGLKARMQAFRAQVEARRTS